MRPAKTWLIADTHFYHDKIMEYESRPADYVERIIANCRRLICPQDLLIHLGDVIFYKMTELKGILDSFPCRKVLTRGNHDRKSDGWYMRNGFDFICDEFRSGEIRFTHIPVAGSAELNVHGHWHTSRHREKPDWWTPATHRLVCLETNGYTPEEL